MTHLETPAECRHQVFVRVTRFGSLEDAVSWFGPDTMGAWLAEKAFAGEPVGSRCGWVVPENA